MMEKKERMTEDDPKQSEAFRKAVRDLEAAGELNGIEGREKMSALLRNFKKPRIYDSVKKSE